jgi:hypothetical protein
MRGIGQQLQFAKGDEYTSWQWPFPPNAFWPIYGPTFGTSKIFAQKNFAFGKSRF